MRAAVGYIERMSIRSIGFPAVEEGWVWTGLRGADLTEPAFGGL